MNIDFLNEEQYSSTLLNIFIVKSLNVEILNNGTANGLKLLPLILIFYMPNKVKIDRFPKQFDESCYTFS